MAHSIFNSIDTNFDGEARRRALDFLCDVFDEKNKALDHFDEKMVAAETILDATRPKVNEDTKTEIENAYICEEFDSEDD